jgi:DNA-binding protein WhiA
MSFSSDLKAEIISGLYKNACCRRSLIHGALSAKGVVDAEQITISVESVSVAEYLSSLIKEFFGRDAIISKPKNGGRRLIVSFKSASAEKFITDFLTCEGRGINAKCAACQSAYIRGIFLVSGRMSDPEKQFCLEFSLGNRARKLLEYFEELGLYLKISERASETLLYTKNSSYIEDFLALAELHSTAFEIINLKISNDFKNNANRLRNFDTVNITKAVDAANSQIAAITVLIERGLLSSLPPELEQTARLRLEHPDMSMTQLANCSVPHVSKS